jgi:hypothetical protein
MTNPDEPLDATEGQQPTPAAPGQPRPADDRESWAHFKGTPMAPPQEEGEEEESQPKGRKLRRGRGRNRQ